MSKKKPAENPKDQHKSKFMVRLPNEGRDILCRIKVKMGQAYTVAVMRALREYAKANGIDSSAAD